MTVKKPSMVSSISEMITLGYEPEKHPVKLQSSNNDTPCLYAVKSLKQVAHEAESGRIELYKVKSLKTLADEAVRTMTANCSLPTPPCSPTQVASKSSRSSSATSAGSGKCSRLPKKQLAPKSERGKWRNASPPRLTPRIPVKSARQAPISRPASAPKGKQSPIAIRMTKSTITCVQKRSAKGAKAISFTTKTLKDLAEEAVSLLKNVQTPPASSASLLPTPPSTPKPLSARPFCCRTAVSVRNSRSTQKSLGPKPERETQCNANKPGQASRSPFNSERQTPDKRNASAVKKPVSPIVEAASKDTKERSQPEKSPPHSGRAKTSRPSSCMSVASRKDFKQQMSKRPQTPRPAADKLAPDGRPATRTPVRTAVRTPDLRSFSKTKTTVSTTPMTETKTTPRRLKTSGVEGHMSTEEKKQNKSGWHYYSTQKPERPEKKIELPPIKPTARKSPDLKSVERRNPTPPVTPVPGSDSGIKTTTARPSRSMIPVPCKSATGMIHGPHKRRALFATEESQSKSKIPVATPSKKSLTVASVIGELKLPSARTVSRNAALKTQRDRKKPAEPMRRQLTEGDKKVLCELIGGAEVSVENTLGLMTAVSRDKDTDLMKQELKLLSLMEAEYEEKIRVEKEKQETILKDLEEFESKWKTTVEKQKAVDKDLNEIVKTDLTVENEYDTIEKYLILCDQEENLSLKQEHEENAMNYLKGQLTVRLVSRAPQPKPPKIMPRMTKNALRLQQEKGRAVRAAETRKVLALQRREKLPPIQTSRPTFRQSATRTSTLRNNAIRHNGNKDKKTVSQARVEAPKKTSRPARPKTVQLAESVEDLLRL